MGAVVSRVSRDRCPASPRGSGGRRSSACGAPRPRPARARRTRAAVSAFDRTVSMSDAVTSDHSHSLACSDRAGRGSRRPGPRGTRRPPPRSRRYPCRRAPSTSTHAAPSSRTRGRMRWSAAGVVRRGHAGGTGEVAVGLVHDDEVGELHDPALDALQLVAAGGRHEEQEHVDHGRDRDLRLADADGLDEHDVEARGLAHEQSLRGCGGRRRRACRAWATVGRTRRASARAAPCASCRRGSNRRCDGSTGRPRAPRPGVPSRPRAARAPR